TLKITNASATGIIVILYDLAIEYIGEAQKCFENRDHDGARTMCTNAGRVLGDLIASLDFTYEISFPLFRIYEFVSKEVSSAVIKDDGSDLDRVVKMLVALRESFEELAKQDSGGPVMSNAETVYAGLTYGRGTLNESSDPGTGRGYTV
nr:flagellar protein FliS [Lachnospiraceae bacterium]